MLFLEALEKKGPKAFLALVNSLRESKRNDVADLLDPASSSSRRATATLTDPSGK